MPPAFVAQSSFFSTSPRSLFSNHGPCQSRPTNRIFRTSSLRMSDTTQIPPPPNWDLKLSSPSKINLFLRILRRRDDGYHDLASLFQAISLRDELFFSILPDDATTDVLECSAPGVPTDSTNLVLRALDTFRARTGVKKHFKVLLEKRVPAQAGLGGGSANAATALWGANVLCGKPATTKELAEFGAEFGSDVSFFFSMGTAYCTGRGEILQGLDRLKPQTLWLIKPEEGLSTGAVFKALRVPENGEDPQVLLKMLQTQMLNTCDAFVNDLEVPSFELEPRLAEIKEELERCGFCRVLMSGSGTCFFCLGEPDHDHFGDTFAEQFSTEYNCKIMRAMFVWRKHPDYWYLQEPTEEELLEWRKERDAGKKNSPEIVV